MIKINVNGLECVTYNDSYIYERYKRSNMYDLTDLYKSYSVFKARAEKEIKTEMEKVGGWSYKVLGGSFMQFSCAYLVHNKNDNNNLYLIYHTAYNRYAHRVVTL